MLKKASFILNWLMLACLAISLLAALRRQFATPGMFFALVPFVSALWAYEPPARRSLVMGSLVINTLYAFAGLVIFIAALLGYAASRPLAVFAGLLICLPCTLNVVVLYRQWRAETSSPPPPQPHP